MKQIGLNRLDNNVPLLKEPNLANIFNIYIDRNSKLYYYNILNSFNIPDKLQESLYTLHHPLPNEYITQFTYRMLKNIEFSWIIAEINKIYNILDPLPVDKPLKVPQTTVLATIMYTINNVKS